MRSPIWAVLTLLSALAFTADVAGAQGRGNGGNKAGKAANGKAQGQGPAFCRSGEGHPVFGWEWCRQRGWDRRTTAWGDWRQNDRVRDRDDRSDRTDRDDRDARDRDERNDRDDDQQTARRRWPFYVN